MRAEVARTRFGPIAEGLWRWMLPPAAFDDSGCVLSLVLCAALDASIGNGRAIAHTASIQISVTVHSFSNGIVVE